MDNSQNSETGDLNSALQGFSLKGTIELHEGNDLFIRHTIYKNDNSYAIKYDHYDLESTPDFATYLVKDLSLKELLRDIDNSLSTHQSNVFLDGKLLTSNTQFSEFINQKILTTNLNNTLMASESKTTISGFVGSSFNYNYNEETKKSVISLTIKPKDGDWVYIKAFNQNADLIKNAIENEDVKKLTITGKMKDAKPYTNKKGDLVEYQELVADTINRHKTVEVNGVIAKVDEKTTSNDKPYTHLFIKNNVAVGGVEKVEQFNITIFQENKKGIPKDVELKVGQPIAIKGEATINRYLDKDNKVKESTNINAWNLDRTPTRLKEQIDSLQKNSAKKAVTKKDAEPKKAPNKTSAKKGKDSGIEM